MDRLIDFESIGTSLILVEDIFYAIFSEKYCQICSYMVGFCIVKTKVVFLLTGGFIYDKALFIGWCDDEFIVVRM